MAKNFTEKLNKAITSVTEKISQVISDHTTLFQTVKELRFVVMREPGQDGLNPVIEPPGVNARTKQIRW